MKKFSNGQLPDNQDKYGTNKMSIKEKYTNRIEAECK